MIKKILSVFLILVIIMLPVNLPSQAAGDFFPTHIAMDRSHGQVVISRDGEKQTDPTLLYKLMVCLLAIENPSNEYTAKVAGETCTFNDLLKLSLLADNNEATAALAEYLVRKTGNLNVFIDKKIRDFKLESTFFNENVTESISNSYTTLGDIGRFVTEANKNAEFNSLFCSQVVLSSDKTLISNTNQMVISAGNTRIAGGSTSTHEEDGNTVTTMCYLGNVTSDVDGSSFDIILVVNADQDYGYEKIGENLIKNLTENYSSVAVVKDGDVMISIPVGNENLDVIAAEDAYCIVPNEEKTPVSQISYSLENGNTFETLELPVTKGQLLGTANITLFDGSTISVSVSSGNDIYAESSSINNIITTLLSNTTILIILLVLVGLEIMMVVLKLYKKRNQK